MPSRKQRYKIANRLYSKGHDPHRIAQVLKCGIEFVDQLINAASWPENKRNAWLLGLNVEKFRT